MAAGQLAQDVLGQQRALVDRVTVVNAWKMPFLGMVRKGTQPISNLLDEWPVDKYQVPTNTPVVDGTDVTTFSNANKNYRVLANRLQWNREEAMVSKLTEDATNQAGIKDPLANAVVFKMEQLWRDVEAACCSDNPAQEGTGTVPNMARGLGDWIVSTAQSYLPVPTEYLTPSGSINTTAMASLTENDIQSVLKSRYDVTGEISRLTFLVGPELKRTISNMTRVQTSTSNVMSIIRVYNQDSAKKQIINVVDEFVGDFGILEIVPTQWNAYFTSSAAQQRRGYVLDMTKTEIVWKQMPKTMPLPDQGGGPRFCVDAIWGLRMYNPQAFGKFAATS